MQADVILDRQLSLNELNRRRLAPATPSDDWRTSLQTGYELALLEGEFIESSRREVSARARQAPSEPSEFVRWFERLKNDGPGQNDPLFDYLAHHASIAELRWFLEQEVAGEAGFDDLVALTQLRFPVRAKLEFARNYWDEMGRGAEGKMHGLMLSDLVQAAVRSKDVAPAPIVAESLALGNLLVGLAYNRRYAYQAAGALGVIELTAPTRAVKVFQALDRLGFSRDESRYFRVHATLDLEHAKAWCTEIFVSLLTQTPALAAHLAEGALMRLTCGLRTFERYRREFGL
jgi:hypothetical protein